jgi:hypothetical protein
MRDLESRRYLWLRSALLFAVCAVLAGCGLGGEARYPTSRQPGQGKPVYDEQQSVFGPGGLSVGGTEKPGEGDSGGGGAGVGVNSFLWRASLDTVSFMPLVSADPFGGVIITDWYSPPQSPDARALCQQQAEASASSPEQRNDAYFEQCMIASSQRPK